MSYVQRWVSAEHVIKNGGVKVSTSPNKSGALVGENLQHLYNIMYVF